MSAAPLVMVARTGWSDTMKLGMNLLLWTTEVTEEHYPALQSLKDCGFDGVEVPVGSGGEDDYTALGKVLDDMGLERTAVFAVDEAANPVSADAAMVRAVGLAELAGEALGADARHAVRAHAAGVLGEGAVALAPLAREAVVADTGGSLPVAKACRRAA